jgi:hypothetical protein
MANCKIKEEFEAAFAPELDEPGNLNHNTKSKPNMRNNTHSDLVADTNLGQGHFSHREVNKPLWQNCEDLERLQQIEVKERAVDDSLSCLNLVEKILHNTTNIKSLPRHLIAIGKFPAEIILIKFAFFSFPLHIYLGSLSPN